MSEKFDLIIPTEIKGLIISLVMIVAGLVISPLIDLLAKHSLPDPIGFLFLVMTPVGVILLIVFGITTLIAAENIFRFLLVKCILVSDQGIALYNRNDSVNFVIGWQQIKKVQFRGLKHMFLGLAEVRREPVGIELNLVDGSNFIIPLYLILKEQDRYRMISIVSHYTSAINLVAANSIPTPTMETPQHRKDELYQRLLVKVRSDKALAERLIEYERKLMPYASEEELIRSAIERLERDNR